MNSRLLYLAFLSIAPLIWGFGFVATRWMLVDYSPSWCQALRYLVCLPIVLPFLLMKGTYKRKHYLQDGFLLAVFLGIAMWIQTIGLNYTSVAKAGFFTVFYAFFTPILCMFIDKRTYKLLYWFLIALALVGIALLCELSVTNFNRGDVLILISAVFFSLHIILSEKVARKNLDSVQLNFVQTGFIALISSVIAFAAEPFPILKPLLNIENLTKASSLTGLIIISIFSTLVAFTIQLACQKKIKAHIASLIFLLESVSAAFFGYLFLGEMLSNMALCGAIIVLLSVALIPLAIKK